VAPAVAPAPVERTPAEIAATRRRRAIWAAAIFFTCAAVLFVVAAAVYFWPTSEAPAVAVTVPAPPAPTAAVVSAAPLTPPPVPRSRPVIVLPATKAQLKGRQIKLEQHDNGPPYVAFWNLASDTVTWRLQVGRAGRYTVSLVYGLAPHAGANGFEVSCGRSKLRYTERLKATGSWYTFDFATLGSLDLPAGPATVVIKALGRISGGGLMNLRELRLQPDSG